MKNKYIFTATLLVLLTVFSAVIVKFSSAGTRGGEQRLVVASLYPVYIAALNVTDGVEGIRLECLTQPTSGCAHDHQLTTKDMRQLERADLFLLNGAGMESYLSSVLERYPDLTAVESAVGAALLEAEEDHHEEGHDEHEELYNSHVWMNMDAYCVQIDNIAKALADLAPEHAKEFTANADRYKKQVQAVKEEGKELELAETNIAVSTHEAFSYFAENFNWKIYATVNMDENTALKAAQVSEVMDAVKNMDIPYVFTEELYGTSLGEILEKETDCQTLVLDTLVSGKMEKTAYLQGMRQNLKVLKEAVEGEKTR